MITEKNRLFLVKSQFGTYSFNNRKTAEQLNKHLTNYEQIIKTYYETDKTLDRVSKQIIQLQMSLKIAQDDLEKIKKELK